MKAVNPVQVTKGSLLFCRIGSTVVLIVGLILLDIVLIAVISGLMLFSWLVKIKHSPMVFIYMNTFDKIWPSKKQYVDENGIRFSHLVGGVLLLIGVVFLYLSWIIPAIIVIGLVTVMKVLGIFGFCTASKLYSCVGSSNCCSFLGKKNA